MLDLTALVSTITFLVLAELGDKTQLVALLISSSDRSYRALLGCVLGFTLVNVATLALGGLSSKIFPYPLIKLLSAALFLAFGILTLRVSSHAEALRVKGLLASLALVGSMELGDKTNLAVLALTAYLRAPLEVLLGLLVAALLLMGSAFLLGSTLARVLSPSKLRLLSAVAFLGVGLYMLIDLIISQCVTSGL